MKEFSLHAELWLPRPLEEVFPFFAEAGNLGKITPPWLKFQLLTPGPLEMKLGLLIDYRIYVRGLPLRWQTEIVDWNPPHQFVDVQRRGPYRLWHHTHRFQERDGGVFCTDDVRYFPIGGALINRLLVRRDVEKIFAYRAQRLHEIFGAARNSTTA